jgi:ribonuclease VapC
LIVDSSALLALVLREPGYERILEALAGAEWIGIGAPTLTETGIVLTSRLGAAARSVLAMLIEDLDLTIVPFDAPHAREARRAFSTYGRGRHVADLNFGDCLTYATAKVAAAPLLFVGEDFANTDLESVLPRRS